MNSAACLKLLKLLKASRKAGSKLGSTLGFVVGASDPNSFFSSAFTDSASVYYFSAGFCTALGCSGTFISQSIKSRCLELSTGDFVNFFSPTD